MKPHQIAFVALTIFGVIALGMSPLARAVARADSGRALQEINANQILPMIIVLQGLDPVSQRRVVEAELVRRGERWVYEVKLLRSNGQLEEVNLDARNGTLVKREELEEAARGRGGERERGREGR